MICARGATAAKHPGNLRFRQIIKDYIPEYSEATSKLEKSLIVSSIVDAVRDFTPNGGFVKEIEDGVWVEVGGELLIPVRIMLMKGNRCTSLFQDCYRNKLTFVVSFANIALPLFTIADAAAREKIGQCIRDQLHDRYKSSTKAKKPRRLELKATKKKGRHPKKQGNKKDLKPPRKADKEINDSAKAKSNSPSFPDRDSPYFAMLPAKRDVESESELHQQGWQQGELSLRSVFYKAYVSEGLDLASVL